MLPFPRRPSPKGNKIEKNHPSTLLFSRRPSPKGNEIERNHPSTLLFSRRPSLKGNSKASPHPTPHKPSIPQAASNSNPYPQKPEKPPKLPKPLESSPLFCYHVTIQVWLRFCKKDKYKEVCICGLEWDMTYIVWSKSVN